ncbi:alkaline phosphatase family protein [Myxococcus sp. K15C18031901]|uniref:alkaline phosphatase family protein n=1 Tax=Myxococcus dinghuensis TaxID=2906761 RepID=UPI0020A794C2|nr:alkaline phosphatase family protein [Myxococcus dinghuensis]MCP3102429.1 alkaline phosphatase family protein [Myxococcus dinghuensis]
MSLPDSAPSITTFRGRLRELLAREGLEGPRRDVVILAVDGIPFELALTSWRGARITPMRSVFPTTSSTAWLSSLTGLDVGSHGIPGVVFQGPGGGTLNVFQHQGPLHIPETGNIFSDANALGYRALAVMGDWEPFDCTWRDALLRHAHPVRGHRFYTAPSRAAPTELGQAVLRAVSDCLDTPSDGPRLVWCFIDADQHIHHAGYDEPLVRFLECLDDVARQLTARGALVLAHSDHGLTLTHHRPELERLMEQLQAEHDCVLGGAGRTRWFHVHPAREDRLVGALERALPSTVRVVPADTVFDAGSLALERVGRVVLIADGDEFMTFLGHRFEHGSTTQVELSVPLARWLE